MTLAPFQLLLLARRRKKSQPAYQQQTSERHLITTDGNNAIRSLVVYSLLGFTPDAFAASPQNLISFSINA